MGDRVSLQGELIQSHEEEIVEIQSKYVRLFQDAIKNFQLRFPESVSIQSINAGNPENFDIEPFLKLAKERREYVEHALQFYRDNPCSLYWLASRLGIDECQLMGYLSDDENEHLSCVGFSSESVEDGISNYSDSNRFVLDISAIVTVSRLDVWGHLDTDKKYYVSRATSELLSAWERKLTNPDGQPAAYTFCTPEGQLQIRDVTEAERQTQLQEIRSMQSQVKQVCSIRSSSSLAKLLHERREAFIEALGYHTLEAISVAKDKNAMLWTDDRLVGLVAKVDFTVDRVWSQLVSRALLNDGHIDTEVCSEINAKLLQWNYVTTTWNARDIFTAGTLANWEPVEPSLRQCLKLFALPEITAQQKAQIALEFFQMLRRPLSVGQIAGIFYLRFHAKAPS